jgi:hypothetical protein
MKKLEMREVLDLDAKCWLGREGSNLRMVESKSTALPLGDAPTDCPEKVRDDSLRGFPPATPGL